MEGPVLHAVKLINPVQLHAKAQLTFSVYSAAIRFGEDRKPLH